MHQQFWDNYNNSYEHSDDDNDDNFDSSSTKSSSSIVSEPIKLIKFGYLEFIEDNHINFHTIKSYSEFDFDLNQRRIKLFNDNLTLEYSEKANLYTQVVSKEKKQIKNPSSGALGGSGTKLPIESF